MRFHLLAFPNCQSTREYSLDGFAMCTIRFAQLLKSLGHTVILYASEENEAPCDELVTIITKEEIEIMVDGGPYQNVVIDQGNPLWVLGNGRAKREIAKRVQPHDFICGLGGESQKPVCDAFPNNPFVEYSIGYQGSFSNYRVFESQAWRHETYGRQGLTDGRFFDDVIPCFFDPAEFHYRAEKEPFVLYVGRIYPRKGPDIAFEAAKAAGVPVKAIGHGDLSMLKPHVEYLGALPIFDEIGRAHV